jgi:hypothetical protein
LIWVNKGERIGVINEDEQIRRSSVFSAAAYIERAKCGTRHV